MIRDIVLDSDKKIREVSKPIDLKEIGAKDLQSLCTDMIDTLGSFKYGVAISAIQIGIPKRIFLIQRTGKDGKRESPKYHNEVEILNWFDKRDRDNLEQTYFIEGF